MAIRGGDGSIILTTEVDQSGLKKGIGSMNKLAATVGKSFLAIAAAAAAATVAITKMAVSAYADYEQLVGGVETLFKGSAQKVVDYANDAFYTAGISANEYMQNVTSFSASLLSSLGGDTEKAADVANAAIISIADNVNKMGSSYESVQFAFQGFAKQQYMLLDNLKLGYGGTKTEMERLLRDAEAYRKSMGETVNYEITNLADVYTAIGDIQEKLGIAGTTALEAERTITGSANMMKAAWQNVLAAIAGGGDLDRAINNLVYSVQKYFENIVPVVERSLIGIGRLIERIAPMLVQTVANTLIKALPSLINAIYQMIVGFAKGIREGIKALFSGGSGGVVAEINTTLNGVSSSIVSSTDNMNALSDATKKAGKEAKKSTAAFDDLNIITSGAGGGGEIETPEINTGGIGGGDTEGIFPDEGIEFKIDTEEAKQNLAHLLTLISSIGASLAIIKISESLLSGSGTLMINFSKVAGYISIIAGSLLLAKGYSDAWVNGLDWNSFLTTISGLALIIGGISLVLLPVSVTMAAIATFLALFVSGIALLAVGIQDFNKNGSTFWNTLSIILGLVLTLVPVFSALFGWIGILIGLIGSGLVTAFMILWEKCDGFRTFWLELWKTIKDEAERIYEEHIKPTLEYMGEKFNELWENYIKPVWEDHIQPAFEEIATELDELYVAAKPILDKIGGLFTFLWNNTLKVFFDDVKNNFDTFIDVAETAFSTIGDYVDNFKDVFVGLIDFLTGVFSGDFDEAMSGINKSFEGMTGAIQTTLKGLINLVIDLFNSFARRANSSLISTLNTIPGLSIPNIPEIPKLATGAVLPPNKPFMAIVGDQKHGTNIEAPLDTIVQAMNIALSQNGNVGNGKTEVVLEIDGREFGRAVVEQGNRENRRIGTRLVIA